MINIIQDRDAFILAWDYTFCPFENSKYDANVIADDDCWNIHANPKHSISVLIKYDSDDLVPA